MSSLSVHPAPGAARPGSAGIDPTHTAIGTWSGQAGYADDVRLECFGLDRDDNEFVIGLLGHRLDALSKLVKAMRGTEQTARYIDRLGPFFVGRRTGHTIL